MRLPILLVSGLALATLACREPAHEPKPAPIAQETAAALPFIADDYARALAEARSRNLPLFVDVWANWCHTCLSLQQYVLPDPALRPLRDRFVWLSIDSERASNAAFLKQFASRNLPTLWVIDAHDEKPLLKWIGAATADELGRVLTEAASGTTSAGATALALRGDRASANGDASSAIALYREALTSAAADWPLRARTVEALSMRLSETHAQAETFELAVHEADRLPASTAQLNVVLNGIEAGKQAKPDAASFSALLQRGARMADDPTLPVLLDDRSSLYLSVIEALQPTAAAQAQQLAQRWAQQLEAAAKSATKPEARRVWDAHRLEAYTAQHEIDKAVPMLEQSEREAPEDYNPPARLARAYLGVQRVADAKQAIARALPRCPGPRKLRLYLLQSEIALADHDKTSAQQALREALTFAQEHPLAPQYEPLRQSIETKLAELDHA